MPTRSLLQLLEMTPFIFQILIYYLIGFEALQLVVWCSLAFGN